MNPPPPVDQGFWTSCPHCCHVHQYAREFLNRKLRCRVCHSPFPAEELPSPPPIVPGTDMYFCSWGFFPLGFPQGTTPPSDWTPLIPCGKNDGTESKEGNLGGTKITARKKICVSKRVNREEVEEEDDDEEEGGNGKGIDVNEEARVSDLMGEEGNGGVGNTGGGTGIGFDIDVDMSENFDLW